MEKPKVLRILAIIAAIVSVTEILLNAAFVFNPHIAAFLLGYGNSKELMEAKLSSHTQILMLIQNSFPLILTAICAINIYPSEASKNRSLLTLVLGGISYPLISFASTVIYTISLRSAMNDGIQTVSLISSVTTVRGVLSHLNVAALVLIMCAAAIEFYITKTELKTSAETH